MKKTLTVNLGGTVYHIDEDAYVLLDNYLNNLKYHFRTEPDADEIVRDMENRIAELFSEYISHGQQVITIENVEEVIARMGKPEEINSESDSSTDADDSYRASDNGESPKRRLFRNPDDKILGGVVSGLAAYFGWDVAWTRIVVLVCGIFLHGFILAYIIAWIIIPMARTATEKREIGKYIFLGTWFHCKAGICHIGHMLCSCGDSRLDCAFCFADGRYRSVGQCSGILL